MSRSTITDTEMQIGKFILPRHGRSLIEEPHEDRYIRSFKEDLPKKWVREYSFLLQRFFHQRFKWFNDSYYGDGITSGVKGHHWHVFGTVSDLGSLVAKSYFDCQPLYYHLPPGAEI
jgi:hypothetical protein